MTGVGIYQKKVYKVWWIVARHHTLYTAVYFYTLYTIKLPLLMLF
jgi:hypothetical protein